MSFNQPKIPPKVKDMAITWRVAEDIRYVEGVAKNIQITQEDCLNETKGSNCQGNHPASSSSSEVYRKQGHDGVK